MSAPAAQSASTSSWRIAIHPAAELFPLMSKDELKELGQNIKKNGLQSRLVLWAADPNGKKFLLDGRNRIAAMELAGLDATSCSQVTLYGNQGVDPYEYVVGANIHRRHLTAEQRRELICKLLKAKPDSSDRQIAATVKADNKTVAAVRTEMEGREEIPHVATRTDSKGRKQPAKKNRSTIEVFQSDIRAKRENGPDESGKVTDEAIPATSYGIEAVTWDGSIWRSGVRLATREEASFYLTIAVDDHNLNKEVIVTLREIRVYETRMPPTQQNVSRKRDGSFRRAIAFVHGTRGDLAWRRQEIGGPGN